MNIEKLQTILTTDVGGNSVGLYLHAVVIFLLLYLGLSFAYRLILRHLDKFAAQTKTDVDDLMVTLLSRLGQPFLLVIALYFSSTLLNMPAAWHILIHAVLVIVLTLRVAMLIEEALRYGIRHVYFRRTKVKNDPVTDSAIGSIIGVLRWIIWLAAILFLLDNLGVNITTLVASIGITGIAVGMASQAILGDMFSAFAIFLDKPFEVGDFVIVDTYMGTIEHIGIKTTRIRSLFGEQLVFANSDLTRSRIKNYKRLEEPRGSVNFTLAYDTSAEKLREASKVILKTLETVPDVRIDHVHLMNFGASGYNYEAAFYVLKGNVARSFDIQEEVFFRIAESLHNAGIMPVAQAQDITVRRQSR
jgi:small-conductance mechanosensitive channel